MAETEDIKKEDINNKEAEDATENAAKAEDAKAADTKAEDVKEAEADADEANEAEEAEGAEADEKKGFFKKKDKKEKQLEEKIAELNDKVMRQMAEFDNFRKRSEKEKSQMYEIGAKDIIEKILPVVDNFERGLATLSDEEKDGAFAQGIDKIYKQLIQVLDDAGVKPIEAVGQPFDPNLHNAVMHEEDPEQGDNLVIEEFQKGYTYRDSVVRHSMVKVVN